MPMIRRYKVTMTRSVEVTAYDSVAACRIAHEAFLYGQNLDNGVKLHPQENPRLEGVWGNTKTKIHDESIFVEEI